MSFKQKSLEIREEVSLFLTLISIVGITTSSRSLICMMGWSAGMGIASIMKQRHKV